MINPGSWEHRKLASFLRKLGLKSRIPITPTILRWNRQVRINYADTIEYRDNEGETIPCIGTLEIGGNTNDDGSSS